MLPAPTRIEKPFFFRESGVFLHAPVKLFNIFLMLPVFTVISRRIYKASGNPYIAGIAFSVVATITLCTNALSAL